jgi:hypothetical protein
LLRASKHLKRFDTHCAHRVELIDGAPQQGSIRREVLCIPVVAGEDHGGPVVRPKPIDEPMRDADPGPPVERIAPTGRVVHDDDEQSRARPVVACNVMRRLGEPGRGGFTGRGNLDFGERSDALDVAVHLDDEVFCRQTGDRFARVPVKDGDLDARQVNARAELRRGLLLHGAGSNRDARDTG